MASKVSKKQVESINSRLSLVMKSGKTTIGKQTTLKAIRNGDGTLFSFLFVRIFISLQLHSQAHHHLVELPFSDEIRD